MNEKYEQSDEENLEAISFYHIDSTDSLLGTISMPVVCDMIDKHEVMLMSNRYLKCYPFGSIYGFIVALKIYMRLEEWRKHVVIL